jgi:quercetin dioxygenase-like cupin family protein
MRAIQIVQEEQAETIHFGGTTISILEDGRGTDNRLGAAIIRLSPHTQPVPPHLHRMHDETFLVTEGTVRFSQGDEHHDAKAGDYVVVSIGASHTFSNPFNEPAAFFNTFSPAFYVNYFRELGRIASDGREPSPEELLRARTHYATEAA